MAPSKSEEEEEEYVGDGGEEASTPFHLPYASPSEKAMNILKMKFIDPVAESGDGAPDDVTMSEFEQDEGHLDCARDSIASPKADLWEEFACMSFLKFDIAGGDAFILTRMLLQEICLGILANLACHGVPRNVMLSKKGLTDAVIEQLFTIDSPCLYEAFRLLTSALQSSDAISWAKMLEPVNVLEQILSVTGNTLNQKLLEKNILRSHFGPTYAFVASSPVDANAFVSKASAMMHDAYAYYSATTTVATNAGGSMPLSAGVGAACSDDGSPTTSIELLLSMVDSQPVADLLLPSLMHLGLPSLLVDLLESEIRQMASGNACDRDNILDTILQVCEVLSLMDVYSAVLFSNKKIFQYACAVVKHCDKDEIGSSCVTATVLLANLISDEPNLAEEISKDFTFLHGLLDILPLVSDDYEASSAFWSLFARLLIRASELMNPPSLRQYASLLAERSVLIAEAVENHLEDSETRKKNSTAKTAIVSFYVAHIFLFSPHVHISKGYAEIESNGSDRNLLNPN
ncbi:hypothetical protein EJ110_NYTH10972 [Nymphaea thermarum]|nr:hypothetical protein EJ110_NYTH10972 [Nymphaea thermarum]